MMNGVHGTIEPELLHTDHVDGIGLERDPGWVDLDRRRRDEIPELILRGKYGVSGEQRSRQLGLLPLLDRRSRDPQPDLIPIERVETRLTSHRQLHRLGDKDVIRFQRQGVRVSGCQGVRVVWS